MGGEDFAYFAEKVPANFVYLGIGNAEKNTTAGLHSPNFKLSLSVNIPPLSLSLSLSLSCALSAEEEEEEEEEEQGYSKKEAVNGCGGGWVIQSKSKSEKLVVSGWRKAREILPPCASVSSML